MGDSYRQEIAKGKKGLRAANPTEADWAQADTRAAFRQQYARKPPVRRHTAIKGQMRFI